jgi:hypothetical protein
VLEALGFCLDHFEVFRNVKAAGQQVQQLRRVWLQQVAGTVSVVGGDLTYLECGRCGDRGNPGC